VQHAEQEVLTLRYAVSFH